MNMHAMNPVFDRVVLTPEDFPREARVKVSTYDWEKGQLVFEAYVVGPSSASHLRIRTDDGLIFAVPAGDCDLLEESCP